MATLRDFFGKDRSRRPSRPSRPSHHFDQGHHISGRNSNRKASNAAVAKCAANLQSYNQACDRCNARVAPHCPLAALHGSTGCGVYIVLVVAGSIRRVRPRQKHHPVFVRMPVQQRQARNCRCCRSSSGFLRCSFSCSRFVYTIQRRAVGV